MWPGGGRDWVDSEAGGDVLRPEHVGELADGVLGARATAIP